MAWGAYTKWFLGTALGGLAALTLLIALADPYGNLGTGLSKTPTMLDVNQRFLYPQIVRSGAFDAALNGTSTSRLLPSERLNSRFGIRLAALSMNSATAWEQVRIADLFLKHAPAPKAFFVGLDVVWCDEAAREGQVTERGFPDWLYDESRLNDLAYMLNTKTVEISARAVGYLIGTEKPRYDPDGYGVFTPPEADYDAERAAKHIWGDRDRRIVAAVPPVELSETDRAGRHYPALDWLPPLFARLPRGALKVMAFMPVHVAAQPQPQSLLAATEAECKARAAAIAQRVGAILIDFRFASPLTQTDANYWDPLHFRVPVAERIVDDIAAAVAGDDAGDAYRVLSRP
ncbi:MAG: hypothetical protein KDJ16_08485 [Hyphomicrobiales bacterium]|nr:hypothetical protein [Hyphomicrobiales bacterium]